ncbi:MAG TPA: aldose epimerase family protein [Verrucomicrobiae bacterium]
MQKKSLWHVVVAPCLLLALSPGLLAGQSSKMPRIDQQPFGSTQDGQAVELYTLQNASGVTAKVMTYGAIIYSFEVPDKNGRFTNVTINRGTVSDYEKRSACFGAVLGRYANRIGGAQFTIDGRQYSLPRNNGRNHIHGGRGFDKRVWQAEPVQGRDFVGVKMSYHSKDGEEGYPGNLDCSVTYSLNNSNEWKMDYTATTDKATVVNLSNHAYWNLAGAESGNVLAQLLTVNADKYLVADEGLIPTGEMASVADTPLDFRKPRPIGERIGQIKEKQFNGGYDHCFVINGQPEQGIMSQEKATNTVLRLALAARLQNPKSGRTMEMLTTEPGVQVYSANFPNGAFEGLNGYSYPRHCGVALETQHFPDSPNKPSFPSTLLRPGQVYRSMTVLKFGLQRE